MKAVIVNADDFGLSEEVNKGILEAFSAGVLSSATILANGGAFEEAASFARRNRRFGFGLHLNLTTGRSLTLGMKEMQKSFLKKALLGIVDQKAVKHELRSQIEKALDAKIRLTHLDGHHHVHVFPIITPIVLDLAEEFKIKKIRLPSEPVSSKRILQTTLLKILSTRAKKQFLAYKVLCPNYFRGIALTGSLDVENFKNILKTLKPGVTEIMCHPGYASKDSLTKLNKERELELATLKDPSILNYIKEQRISILHYGDLK